LGNYYGVVVHHSKAFLRWAKSKRMTQKSRDIFKRFHWFKVNDVANTWLLRRFGVLCCTKGDEIFSFSCELTLKAISFRIFIFDKNSVALKNQNGY